MSDPNATFIFALHDLARTLKLYADQKASQFGMTRAQWAVLAKLERSEGLKQSELAELLDVQPITLTRLIDRLCDNGLIERRADADDRRAKRLYLTKAAKQVLSHLHLLRAEITNEALKGFDDAAIRTLVGQLDTIKDNMRDAMNSGDADNKVRRHG
jgi:MarR family transcriptional regulator, transcriptional regulator for hemolysin